MDRKLILAIDFNNMLFGSYYSEKLINSKGININAIKGFFFKLKSLKDIFNPTYIVIANDIGRDRTFRRALYKPYKAQRKTHDEDILEQMKYAMQIAALLGYPFINNELYEADDIIGMISKYSQEHDYDIIIASSDKDLYQLLEGNTYILSPRNKDLIDKQWLYDNYKLTPYQWIELKMLMGDRSDNIPGIDGIGEVNALRLLHHYDNIENIYKNISQLKPVLQEKLIKGKNKLPLVRELVTIVTDYTKINFDQSMLENTGVFRNELFDVLRELELFSLFNVMNYSLLVDNQVYKSA